MILYSVPRCTEDQPPPKSGYSLMDSKPAPMSYPVPPMTFSPRAHAGEWVYQEVAPQHLIEALAHEYYNSIYPM